MRKYQALNEGDSAYSIYDDRHNGSSVSKWIYKNLDYADHAFGKIVPIRGLFGKF